MSLIHKNKKKDKRQLASRIIYLMVFLLVAFYVSKMGGALAYTLFYTVLIYPVLALVSLLYQRSKIRIHQEIPARELDKNTEVDYCLTVENAGLLPVSGVTLSMYRAGVRFLTDLTAEKIALLPGEKHEYATRLSCKYAGSYVIGVETLMFVDAFGLFRLSMKNPNPLRVQVVPGAAKTEDEERELPLELSGEGTKDDELPGNDVAAYTGAEPLSKIHWKNFARSGELLVRLPEQQGVSMVNVAMLARPGETCEEDLKRRDEFLEYAVSVAGYFVRQRKPVRFYFYNAGVREELLTCEGDLRRFCRAISKELVFGDKTEKIDVKLADAVARPGSNGFLLKEGEEVLCPI